MSMKQVLLIEISNQKTYFLMINTIWELQISASLLQSKVLWEILPQVLILGYARPCSVLQVTWHQKSIWVNHIKALKLICSHLLLSFSLWLLDTHLSLRLLQKINTTKLLLWINQMCSGKLIANKSQQEKTSSLKSLKNWLSVCFHLIQMQDQQCKILWTVNGWMEIHHLKKMLLMSLNREISRLLLPWKLKKNKTRKKKTRELICISQIEDQEEKKKRMSPNTLNQRKLLKCMTLVVNNLPKSTSLLNSILTLLKRNLLSTWLVNNLSQKSTRRNTKLNSIMRHQLKMLRIRITPFLCASEFSKLMMRKFALSSIKQTANKTNSEKL